MRQVMVASQAGVQPYLLRYYLKVISLFLRALNT